MESTVSAMGMACTPLTLVTVKGAWRSASAGIRWSTPAPSACTQRSRGARWAMSAGKREATITSTRARMGARSTSGRKHRVGDLRAVEPLGRLQGQPAGLAVHDERGVGGPDRRHLLAREVAAQENFYRRHQAPTSRHGRRAPAC